MQKKGAEVKNYKRATIEQAGKVFGPYAPEAFKALSEAAAKGDIPALEQMRKWIFGEEDLKQNAGTNIVIQVGKEEALAIDKWSKK